jgi:serine/threonine protein kinase
LNYSDLRLLCDEIGFSGLAEQLRVFDYSVEPTKREMMDVRSRIEALERAGERQLRMIGQLESKVSRLQREVESLNCMVASQAQDFAALQSSHASLLSLVHTLESRLPPIAPPFDPRAFLRTFIRELSDYEEIRRIGRGSCRDFFLARELSSGKEVVLGQLFRDERYYREYFVERATLPLILNLPWIVPTLGFIADAERSVIVNEYFANRTLADVLKAMHAGKTPAGFGPTQLTKCVFGIAFVMSAIHSRGVIHGNLSDKAVFLDSKFEPFLGRLGSAKIPQSVLIARGTAPLSPFMAPELFEEDVSGQPVDVYAFAVLLCEIFGPLVILNAMKKNLMNRDGFVKLILSGRRFERPQGMPDPFWALISDCWQQNPADRPTFPAIVDRLKCSRDLMIPGTDIRVYQEYQNRLCGTHLDDPRSIELTDTLYDIFGFDRDAAHTD